MLTNCLMFIFQAHSTMHNGHPCPNISNEYFKDGITNGAHWYSVSGKSHLPFCTMVVSI